jgi:hypothetical protein
MSVHKKKAETLAWVTDDEAEFWTVNTLNFSISN